MNVPSPTPTGPAMRSIVCISGTSRPDNFTSRALGLVVDELTNQGADAVVFDGRDLDLAFPGQPPTDDARRLTEAVRVADAVVLATPEYHGSFSALAKLVVENLGFPSVMAGKPVALVGVAAGRIGAIKSLEQLRGVCAHVGAIVLPGAISIAGIRGVFDADGRVVNEPAADALRGVATSLLEFIQSYVCPKHILEEMVREGGAEPWATSV